MSFQIEKPFLIVVEGADDKAVLSLLLTDLGIETVQIIDAMGKHRIREVVGILAGLEGFEPDVQGVAIICDADANPDTERQRCRESLRGLSKRTRFFVMPGDGPGMLEDLCLRAVQERPEVRCAERYMACLADSDIAVSNPPKFRMRAFMMVHDQESTHKVGWAVGRRLLDPAHEAFAPLREFLAEFTRA